MRHFFPLSVLCLAAGVGACRPDVVVETEDIPTAGVRFINAVPDTGSMDFRAVDLVENSSIYNVAFRTAPSSAGGGFFYKNARAGSRHFKIFRTPTATDPAATQIATAATVVVDTTVTLDAGKLYTFILWGLSRTGQSPAMKLTIITDDPPDPGNQVALRIINACVPTSAAFPNPCGAATTGVVDARVFTNDATDASTIDAPSTSWTGIAPLTVSAYRNVSPCCTGNLPGTPVVAKAYTFDFRSAGGVTTGAALASGSGPNGLAEAIDADAVPGTNIGGSAVTAILFPRSQAGTQAPQSPTATFGSPGIIFVWDRRPPRTCTLC